MQNSTSLSQCEKNSISVNFTIDNVDSTLNKSAFVAALPSNVVVKTIEEIVVFANKVCPAGYFCPPDTTKEVPCAAGTYFNGTNAMSQSNCTSCPPGTFCRLASVLPVMCAAGTYGSGIGFRV
jgi:hypothetical protein